MTARLLFPAIRWDPGRGAWDTAPDRRSVLAELGVGGFIIFGGPAEAAAELVAGLRAAAPHPILVAADLERGAGQQFPGATPLPPAAALGYLDDPEVTRRAGSLTGREALALGVDWVLAPVADLDVEPDNPIVGTRAFGATAEKAARHVTAWIEGCREHVMACAKHYPGHGRTTADSHLELPSVDVDAAVLAEDRVPFQAAVDAGVDGIMTAHVAYPALDPSGAPATLSVPILASLREGMGFRGLVMTDALTMAGVRGGGSVEIAAARAVEAGCDVLLYPEDPGALATALAAVRGVAVDPDRLDAAVGRIRTAARAARDRRAHPVAWGEPRDRAWAEDRARSSVYLLRGDPPTLTGAGTVDILTLDDDLGGPFPPPARTAFPGALKAAGVPVSRVDRPGPGPLVVAVYADIRGYKGRPGLSPGSAAGLEAALAGRDATVVLFGPPRLAHEIPDRPGISVVCAWGREPLMQAAAARWLTEAPR